MKSFPLGPQNTVEFIASLPFSQHSLPDVSTKMYRDALILLDYFLDLGYNCHRID